MRESGGRGSATAGQHQPAPRTVNHDVPLARNIADQCKLDRSAGRCHPLPETGGNLPADELDFPVLTGVFRGVADDLRC